MSISHDETVILRWKDLICDLHQKNWRPWMQAPTVGDLEMLERVARYLIGHGRLVQEFVRHIEEPSPVVVLTDSDHAGDV